MFPLSSLSVGLKTCSLSSLCYLSYFLPFLFLLPFKFKVTSIYYCLVFDLYLNHFKTNMASQTPAPPDVYNIVIKHVDMMVKPMDQKYCELKQADNAKDFTICHRALGGETNLRYLPEDNTATCVIKSINICLAMLRDQQVRNALTEIAASYSQTYPTAWYLQEASPKHKGDMNRVTDDFLLKILERFPILWVDHTLECLRMYAVAMRRPWHGDFKASSQCIMINVYVSEKSSTVPPKGCSSKLAKR